MNIHPSNDSFESKIIENNAGFKVLDSRYIAYVMEALRYTLSGNCEYFLPVYNSECGIITESPVDIIISCEGATDHMYFSQLNGDWDVYVDRIFYPSLYDPVRVIQDNFDSVIYADTYGGARFWNVTNVPHRFRFVPKQSNDGIVSYLVSPANINQSFMELEDGSLVFCLAPEQI